MLQTIASVFKPLLWLGQKYNKLLLDYPLTVSCGTTGSLSALGDYISQIYLEQKDVEKKDRKFNEFRMWKMTILGVTFFGPHALMYY